MSAEEESAILFPDHRGEDRTPAVWEGFCATPRTPPQEMYRNHVRKWESALPTGVLKRDTLVWEHKAMQRDPLPATAMWHYWPSFMGMVASFVFVTQNHNYFLLSCFSPLGLHTFAHICIPLAQSFIPFAIRKKLIKEVRSQPCSDSEREGANAPTLSRTLSPPDIL